MIPSVAASERGGAQTKSVLFGVEGRQEEEEQIRRSDLEGSTGEGNSPVAESVLDSRRIPSTAGHEKSRRNPAGPSAKAKYSLATDSEAVP
jgi:hypothetical protein